MSGRVGVHGEGGLAGAGQPEEQGRLAVRPHVGGAVHGQHVLRGEQVVHDREDGLLDLAGVARAADHHQPACEVNDDEGLGPGAVDSRVGLELRQVDDGELRVVVLQFLDRRTNEEAAGKQAVPGVGRDDADGQPVARVGAGVEVLHVQVAALGERAGAGEERLELRASSNGWLFGPHQSSPSFPESWTTHLSLGERPVCGVVMAINGPWLHSSASPRRTACS